MYFGPSFRVEAWDLHAPRVDPETLDACHLALKNLGQAEKTVEYGLLAVLRCFTLQ